MKDELVSGLKNAIERGSSLEQAIQSFLNAGYSPTDVSDAARFVSSGATSILYGSRKEDGAVERSNDQLKTQEMKQPLQQSIQQQPSQPVAQQPLQQSTEGKPKKRGIGLIVVVVIMLALFAGTLAYLLYVLSKGTS